MAIRLTAVSYAYDTSATEVFANLSLSIDPSWKLALVGANGRGKSTLLRLLHGDLCPDAGRITCSQQPLLLPQRVPDPTRRTIDLQYAIASRHDASSDLLPRLHAANARLGIPSDAEHRPFASLSGGEQTRALLAAVTVPEGVWPLFDEPTNHLDAEGKALVADYLRQRHGGFILASHDEDLLATTCDHVVSIERDGVHCVDAPYRTWKAERSAEREREERETANRRREVQRLTRAAQAQRGWSAITEREKDSAVDSGFVSRKAAKMMKRALHVERRRDAELEAASALLGRFDAVPQLVLPMPPTTSGVVLTADRLSIRRGERVVVNDLSFTLRAGSIIAVCGPNGSGKSSIVHALEGSLSYDGSLVIPKRFTRCIVHQQPLWQQGRLADHVLAAGIDRTRYRTVLAALGVRGDVFDRDLSTFSYGQWKKIDLARSFLMPYDLIVWDEPFNGLDPDTRDRVADAVAAASPTMLIIDHDTAALSRFTTDVIRLMDP